MQLTTTNGATVEVPVTLPYCFTFYAYLPTLGGVHEFVCWPSSRSDPANAEPACIAFADSDGTRQVSPEDLDAEDRTLYDAWIDSGAPDEECPFMFLDHRDAGAVSEAAGDVLEFVATRMGLTALPPKSYPGWLPLSEAILARDTLHIIADLRAAEVALWEAWEKVPEHMRREVRFPPKHHGATDGTAREVLEDVHVFSLMEMAEDWSREKAERIEQEANLCRCDTERSGSEKQGGVECVACQR